MVETLALLFKKCMGAKERRVEGKKNSDCSSWRLGVLGFKV